MGKDWNKVIQKNKAAQGGTEQPKQKPAEAAKPVKQQPKQKPANSAESTESGAAE